MKRFLFVGQTPETVDFSDPALPPNFDPEKIHAGIAVAMRQMTDRGWQADLCLVHPDKTAGLSQAPREAISAEILSSRSDRHYLWMAPDPRTEPGETGAREAWRALVPAPLGHNSSVANSLIPRSV
jgi:hypothetical protein